jgi:hypothetical protein
VNFDGTPGDRRVPPEGPRHTGRRVALVALALVAMAGLGVALRPGVRTALPSAPPVPVAAPAASDTAAAPHRVIAYYFHTTYRCSSCRKIEAYARQAMNTGFEQELADGRLVWRVVNIEEDGNEHFVKDYQLYTKSVILSDERSGREVRWKNLAKVWELLNDEAGFVDYVQTETRAYLDDVQ